MNIAALLTSAGINIGLCVVLLSLYSILRKQPSNFSVYFGRRLAQVGSRPNDPNFFYRFVPSPSWLVKAWETTEDEILDTAGVDAVVFLRIIVFSLRIFSLAAFVALFLVAPLNYYGQEMRHKEIAFESLEVFTIENVREGSRWLWGHCLALYLITFSACLLLYFEYKNVTNIRLTHLRTSPPNPSHFAVLVRSIPWSHNQSYSDTVEKFFSDYHATSYLGHQMVYRCGKVQKLMSDAEKMCKVAQRYTPTLLQCGFHSSPPTAFRILSREESNNGKPAYHDLATAARGQEVAAAFVFFKTRYAAFVAAEVLQSSNPMLWVTDMAPEPHDAYWSNLCIPYRQLWIRKLASLIATIVFMFLFLIPVTFVQGLTQLDRLHHTFPFLRGLLKKKYMSQLITGYLPSVILMLFLYAVPPTMMLFSAIEGYTSRSGRKKSACGKVLVFMIWNVFFVNVLSGSVISQMNVFSSPKQIPSQLAKAVPAQASFFTTYLLTSGWASLSSELMQPVALIWKQLTRFIVKKKDDLSESALSFPYHTEVPRVLLFGFLGFNFSILAPLILPFLLAYFFYAYLVYRNQILNVYISKYESGGKLWPTAHNTTIVSLVLTQVIALGVFGLKRSSVASAFTIPLIVGTLLFNEYCRQRFHPIFKNNAAQLLIDMDRQDEQNGRLEEVYHQLKSIYSQLKLSSSEPCKSSSLGPPKEVQIVEDPIKTQPAKDSVEESRAVQCNPQPKSQT